MTSDGDSARAVMDPREAGPLSMRPARLPLCCTPAPRLLLCPPLSAGRAVLLAPLIVCRWYEGMISIACGRRW